MCKLDTWVTSDSMPNKDRPKYFIKKKTVSMMSVTFFIACPSEKTLIVYDLNLKTILFNADRLESNFMFSFLKKFRLNAKGHVPLGRFIFTIRQ